jgi:hypothetical protein
MRTFVLVLAAALLAAGTAEARPRHHHHVHHHRHSARQHIAPMDIRPAAQEAGERLIRVARAYLGRGKFTRMPGAWCRDGLNVWLRQAGLYTDGDRRAATAARLGRRISRPMVGAIAVMAHHTGIVTAVEGGRVRVLSANYSRHVGEGFYRVRGVRFILPARA